MKVLLCVSASVAVYKACELVRALIKNGHEVRVVMSPLACQMISPILIEALGAEVFLKDTGKMEHISLSRWCDVLFLCPATATKIGQIANGVGGNLLLDIFLARKQNLRTVLAPAMNVEMWNNPFVQENVSKLKKYGFEFIEPSSGTLACGEEGRGKLASIEEIVQFLFPQIKMRVIITAGGTIEKLDDVRYITNISSGKQALEIAKAFFGCEVVVIKAKTDVPFPSWCNVIEVESGKDMLHAVQMEISKGCDAFISAAAVADFTFNKTQGKVKKMDINRLDFIPNPDILQAVTGSQNRPRCVVGFAAESENVFENANEKMHRKGCDFIVGNELVFGLDKSCGVLIGAGGEQKFECSKAVVARMLKNAVFDFLQVR